MNGYRHWEDIGYSVRFVATDYVLEFEVVDIAGQSVPDGALIFRLDEVDARLEV